MSKISLWLQKTHHLEGSKALYLTAPWYERSSVGDRIPLENKEGMADSKEWVA